VRVSTVWLGLDHNWGDGALADLPHTERREAVASGRPGGAAPRDDAPADGQDHRRGGQGADDSKNFLDAFFVGIAVRRHVRYIRDHLTVDEAARLPTFVRGVFYEGWDPSRTPEHARDLDSFLNWTASETGLAGETEASFVATAASRVPRRHISAGAGDGTLRALPQHLRELLTPEDS
jgi:uncharacterized protein (DUF2267 family)